MQKTYWAVVIAMAAFSASALAQTPEPRLVTLAAPAAACPPAAGGDGANTPARAVPDADASPAMRALALIPDRLWQTESSAVLLERVVAASSREALLAAAAQGDANAQALVGRGYDEGLSGFPEDPALGANYYQAAAEQGQMMAINNLGFLLDTGRGVPQDQGAAAACFAMAAEMGSMFAQANLAHMYLEGRGVAQDDAQAFRLYGLSAAQGHPPGLAGLAWMYQSGRGAPADTDKAVRLYRMAAQAGDEQAIAALSALSFSR